MVDYHSAMREALITILPTYYESELKSGLATPCISYMENNNYTHIDGDTIAYSFISYTVKVWGNSIKELQQTALAIDAVLRPLGFKRTASGELFDKNSTMKQKILTYEALAKEEY